VNVTLAHPDNDDDRRPLTTTLIPARPPALALTVDG
jgi:hypothetical protein